MHWLWVMKATFDGCGLKKNLTMRWGMTVMQQIILESRCFGHIFIVSSAGEWLQWASINSWTKLKDSDRHSCAPQAKAPLLSQVPCITSVHLVVCVEWIIQNCGPVERCTWTTATTFFSFFFFLTTALNVRKWKHLQVTKLIRLKTVTVCFSLPGQEQPRFLFSP